MVRKTKKHGGDFLGSGTYGSVHCRPRLACFGEIRTVKDNQFVLSKDDNMVSKIFTEKKFFQEEYNNAIKFDKRDKNGLFHTKLNKKCYYRDQIYRDYNMLIYQYGGIEVRKHFDSINNPENVAYIMEKLQTTDETNLMRSMLLLFQGIRMFNNKGLIHFDVKPENVVFNDQNQFRLIDFGLATTLSDCTAVDEFFAYTFFQYYHPLLYFCDKNNFVHISNLFVSTDTIVHNLFEEWTRKTNKYLNQWLLLNVDDILLNLFNTVVYSIRIKAITYDALKLKILNQVDLFGYIYTLSYIFTKLQNTPQFSRFPCNSRWHPVRLFLMKYTLVYNFNIEQFDEEVNMLIELYTTKTSEMNYLVEYLENVQPIIPINLKSSFLAFIFTLYQNQNAENVLFTPEEEQYAVTKLLMLFTVDPRIPERIQPENNTSRTRRFSFLNPFSRRSSYTKTFYPEPSEPNRTSIFRSIANRFSRRSNNTGTPQPKATSRVKSFFDIGGKKSTKRMRTLRASHHNNNT